MMKTMNIVLVGHIDHGKSTLIGRLLHDTKSISEEKLNEVKEICEALGREMEYGFLLDHLREEREQGITIDTAQIWFKTDRRTYVIIDAPGHVEFTRNMITGASQAEAAVLIVSAKEGVEEQTRRHAYLLSMLGLKQVIVVVNKMDLVDYSKERFKEVEKQVRDFLKKISIKPGLIIPASAKIGDNVIESSDNMPWYNGESLIESLDSFEPEYKTGALRLPLQDVYKIKDKRIAVGRVESGKIEQSQPVVILPDGKKSEIKSIEKFHEDTEKAETGESIGITLNDPVFVERGNVICGLKDLPTVSDKIKATVFCMIHELNTNTPVTLKLATQEVTAEITDILEKIDSSSLELTKGDVIKTNEAAKVIIETDKKIVTEDFSKVPEMGRFVLEIKGNIKAGGIIHGP